MFLKGDFTDQFKLNVDSSAFGAYKPKKSVRSEELLIGNASKAQQCTIAERLREYKGSRV